MNEVYTKMTLEIKFPDALSGAANQTFTVKGDRWDYTLPDIIDDIVIPLLLAAGYNPKLVNDLFDD